MAAALPDDRTVGLPARVHIVKTAAMKGRARKSVLVHIGANKTGSSAIQAFLKLNVEPLARHGVHVAPADLMPGGPITGQHVPFFEHLREDMEFGRKVVKERIALLLRQVPAGGKLVISAENLSNLNGTQELFADTAEHRPLEVLFYIRRQDELLLSSWQQWGSKTSADFWAWIVTAAGFRGDWRTALERWEALVPRQRIAVRIYDRKALQGGNLISDFLHHLGVADHPAEFPLPESTANVSYSEAVLDFVKGNPLLFQDMHDDTVYRMVGALTGERFHRKPRESIITHEERLALLHKYRAINNWVKNRYFPQRDGPLFPDPKPEDYEVLTPETLRAQKWELAASLVHGLSRLIPR